MFVLVQLELLRVPALELAQLAAVLDHVRILETAAFLRSTNNRKDASTTFFCSIIHQRKSLLRLSGQGKYPDGRDTWTPGSSSSTVRSSDTLRRGGLVRR